MYFEPFANNDAAGGKILELDSFRPSLSTTVHRILLVHFVKRRGYKEIAIEWQHSYSTEYKCNKIRIIIKPNKKRFGNQPKSGRRTTRIN
jgi:hypothetical protein